MFHSINLKAMENPPFFSHFIAFSDEQMLDLYLEACKIYLIYRDVELSSNVVLLWSDGSIIHSMIYNAVVTIEKELDSRKLSYTRIFDR